MFLRGGLLHLAGNMLYLWIFGNNVEDAMGHGRSSCSTFVCGAAAALAMAYVEPASHVPMIGASGAISGVLAAYLLLYPRARHGYRAAWHRSLSLRHRRHVGRRLLVPAAADQRQPCRTGPAWHRLVGACGRLHRRTRVDPNCKGARSAPVRMPSARALKSLKKPRRASRGTASAFALRPANNALSAGSGRDILKDMAGEP